ncbi:gamma-glutamyltransferase [Kordiimonas pumila]|uniref:Gamma-glutamyltransferase n=1 Tax=Kordiimonas pumila TaxID=2161677 RepID=A0ABV7D8D2_9PROT|nr:gamma-glutamyltransferase [Kordiimonas pumila]
MYGWLYWFEPERANEVDINRRTFVMNAGAGLASTALASHTLHASGFVATEATMAGTKTEQSWKPLSDEKRRQLIDKAHFGFKEKVSGTKGVAVSTHPLASHAAMQVLEDGGNAADAIVAASLMQTVVEPHMTCLTGVFSMLYYEAKTGKIYYLNGSNNRPLNHPKDWGISSLTKDLKTGMGVTTPGYWAGVEAALARFGVLSKKRIMAPAIHYARNGFETHPFLWGEIFAEVAQVGKTPQGREIFMPNGFVPRPGEKLYQKRAADLLERLAEEGSDYYYRGAFAQKFSETVQRAGGCITPEDFEKYEVRWDEPAVSSYRGYTTVGSPPPDHGGTNVLEVLNQMENIDFGVWGAPWASGDTAFKLLQVIADVSTDTVVRNFKGTSLPMEERLSKERAARRFKALGNEVPQSPWKILFENAAPPPPGSNHLTVIDGAGNAATVLHSIMSWPWSNGLFVDGVSICAASAHYASGLPKRGERINAGIVPTMVFKNGKPVIVGGSPSVSVVPSVVQNIINHIDFGLDIKASVEKPRLGGGSISNPGAYLMEAGMGDSVISRARELGVPLDVVNPYNWHHGSFDGLFVDGHGVVSGCGDPRRTAMAMAL